MHRLLKSKVFLALVALLFAASANADDPVWEANAVTFVQVETGPGAIALIPDDAAEKVPAGLPVATTAGVVTGDNATLIVETRINEHVFRQIEDAANGQGVPVRFAVNTSFHGDHSYGNHLLAPGILVVQHAFTDDYIDRHFEEDVAFMKGLFGEGRGIEDARPRPADLLIGDRATLTLDLGNRPVDLIDFGFAQTGGDIMVWDRASKTLWTGNPVIAAKPSLPWLLDGNAEETLATLRRVRAFLPDDAIVIPGHGAPMAPQDIDWHIDYLAALIALVKGAIEEGLDAEAFAARSDLPQFSGYALYPWVHTNLNAPKTFAELSAN